MSMSIEDDGKRGEDQGGVPPLRREVCAPISDHSRMAGVAGAFSLVGIGVGFGLSVFALHLANAMTTAMSATQQRVRPAEVVPFLGIEFVTAHFADGPLGVSIRRVHIGTPAEDVGLRAGDVILAYNGEVVDSDAELVGLVQSDHVGGQPLLNVLRDGKRIELTPTLDARLRWR